MQTPHGVPEVLFCDLCNTSVPLQDIELGSAVRHQGKTVGACCLGPLRGPGGSSTSASAPATRAIPGDGRIVTLGVVLLVAVAAAALFLDDRIGRAESQEAEGRERLAYALRAQGEVVQSISLALDGKAERGMVQELVQAQASIASAQTEHGLRLQTVGGQVAALTSTQAELARALAAAEKARPDLAPALADLQQQLRQQSVTLAEILARPRTADAMSGTQPDRAPSTPPAGELVGDLPPEIAHQVARLADRDEGVRFEAVDDLLKRREPRVLPHLLPLIKDPDTFVRRIVAEGLKDFVAPEVVDALLVALADPEEIVRDSAWRSLKDLTRQSLPFEAAGSRDARARQQQKWQEWWEKNRSAFGG